MSELESEPRMRCVKVTLDQDYEVPGLTIGQAEDVAPFWDMIDADGRIVDAEGRPLVGKALITRTLDMAAIVLRRAKPEIGNIRNIECTLGELSEAIVAVFRFSNKKASPAGEGQAGASPAA